MDRVHNGVSADGVAPRLGVRENKVIGVAVDTAGNVIHKESVSELPSDSVAVARSVASYTDGSDGIADAVVEGKASSQGKDSIHVFSAEGIRGLARWSSARSTEGGYIAGVDKSRIHQIRSLNAIVDASRGRGLVQVTGAKGKTGVGEIVGRASQLDSHGPSDWPFVSSGGSSVHQRAKSAKSVDNREPHVIVEALVLCVGWSSWAGRSSAGEFFQYNPHERFVEEAAVRSSSEDSCTTGTGAAGIISDQAEVILATLMNRRVVAQQVVAALSVWRRAGGSAAHLSRGELEDQEESE